MFRYFTALSICNPAVEFWNVKTHDRRLSVVVASRHFRSKLLLAGDVALIVIRTISTATSRSPPIAIESMRVGPLSIQIRNAYRDFLKEWDSSSFHKLERMSSSNIKVLWVQIWSPHIWNSIQETHNNIMGKIVLLILRLCIQSSEMTLVVIRMILHTITD